MRAEVVAVLRCPITHKALQLLGEQDLADANARVECGELRYVDGSAVTRKLDAALASADGAYLFPVENDIAVLLAERAIDYAGAGGLAIRLDEIRVRNQTFYDEIGWTKAADDADFQDATLFEDLRDVSADYIRKCHLRVKRYLHPNGRFFLDAASGPIQFDEYLTYSEGYDTRLCVDFSFAALMGARRRIGEHGAYLLADVTNLPLADGTIDGGVSLHTIYHVPADEQEEAFRELHRVLRPGRSAVVVYSWRHSIMRVFQIPQLVGRVLRRRRDDATEDVDLYFRPRSQRWFLTRPWPERPLIRVWRSVSVLFLKSYVPSRPLGRRLLSAVYWLEERMPRLLGLIGEYPLIVIAKADRQGGRSD